jgi:hypothetical protein
MSRLSGSAVLTGLSLALAFLTALPAEAQFYRPRDPFGSHLRVDTYQPQRVLPAIVVQGDWLLTGWGPSAVETPGIALVQLSTGEPLWTVIAEPEESLTPWLDGKAVYLQRSRREAETFDLQLRDAVTGTVLNTHESPIDPAMVVTQILETVIIMGPKEVLDKRTGQRRGVLPAEVYYNDVFCELGGKLYGHAIPEPRSPPSELLEVDLETLQVTRRWNIADILGDERFVHPIITNGSLLIFSTDGRLTALDLKTDQRAWQIEIAPLASLLFVNDLAAPVDEQLIPPDLPVRPLLVEWATGEHRVGDLPDRRVDLLQWNENRPLHLEFVKPMDRGTVFHFRRESAEQLIGLDDRGKRLWNHERTLTRSGEKLICVADWFAALPAASLIEIIDLDTGAITHQIQPESVGLTSHKTAIDEYQTTNAIAKNSTVKPSVPFPVSGTTSLILIVAGLLIGYVVIRRLTGGSH